MLLQIILNSTKTLLNFIVVLNSANTPSSVLPLCQLEFDTQFLKCTKNCNIIPHGSRHLRLFAKEKEESPVGNCTRHTTCSITCPGGYPSLDSVGVLQSWPGGYPSPGQGCASVLTAGTPVLVWGTPVLGNGYACPGVPLSQVSGTPGKDLEPETWERTWDWGTPGKDMGKNLGLGYPQNRTWNQTPVKEPGTRVPPCVDWQTNSTYYLPPSFGCGQ